MIKWIENWYSSNCDGDWEHSNGIHIKTLDNPGWSIDIKIDETQLKGKKLKQIEINRSEGDWIFCRVKDGCFEGRGGSQNLSEIIEIFKNWVEYN